MEDMPREIYRFICCGSSSWWAQNSSIGIVDEPQGVYYGGSVAAPVAGDLIEETLNYLDVPPKYTEEEKENMKILK